MILTVIIIPLAANFVSSRTPDVVMSGRIWKIGLGVTAILLVWQAVTFSGGHHATAKHDLHGDEPAHHDRTGDAVEEPE